VRTRDTVALVNDLRGDVYTVANWVVGMSYRWNSQQRQLRESKTPMLTRRADPGRIAIAGFVGAFDAPDSHLPDRRRGIPAPTEQAAVVG
jgi:hypothetical protein